MKRIFDVLLLCCLAAYGSADNTPTTTGATSAQCDKDGAHLYLEMGYTGSTPGGNSCPTSYAPPALTPANSQCIFRGATYPVGPLVDPNNKNPCNFCNCQCDSELKNCNVTCTKPFCTLPCAGNKGCVNTFSVDKCCATSCTCPTSSGAAVPRATCADGTTTYYDGETYYPAGGCLECTCRAGGPICQSTFCGVELNYKQQVQNKCAPYYCDDNADQCCPDLFICQAEMQQMNVISQGTKGSPLTCAFGNTTYNLGASILFQYGANHRVVLCKCKIPPLMTCVDF